MKYRKFGNLDWEASALGFGTMRLPVTKDNPVPRGPDIDEPEAIKMIRYAIDNGVNYVDTAYMYHGGNSELLVGKALKDGYREKVKLATKLPSNYVDQAEDFDKVLNDQLRKLQTDHIDFYLLHAIDKTRWDYFNSMDILDWVEKTIADGRINHMGFSFHGDLEAFKEIVDAYDNWTLCQIQYNYMDIEYQAGTEGLKYAAEKGLAVVTMESLRGGQLSKEQPPSIKKLYEDAAITQTPAGVALQWLWNQPEVSVVLSGMTTMEDVIENVASAGKFGAGSMSDKEIKFVDQIREEYIKIAPVNCTTCGYCMPCPNGVDIPHAFSQYNYALMFDDPRVSRYWYRSIPKENWADNCIECHECEEQCPQGVEIAKWLKEAHGWLGPLKKKKET